MPLIADADDEAAEAVRLLLTSGSGAAIADAAALGTIQDDDDPGISVADTSVIEGNSTTNAVFDVTLSRTTPFAISTQVTVPVTGDTAVEGNETFRLTIPSTRASPMARPRPPSSTTTLHCP